MMDEILDDDLFLGLLAANPRGHGTTKAQPAVHAEPWHDNMQSDGLQTFLNGTPSGSFGSASTCQKSAMWVPAPTNSWTRAVPFSRSPPVQEILTLPTTRQSARSLERGELSAHGLGSHTSSTARSLMHTTSTGRSHASTLTALEPRRGTAWAGWLPELSGTEGYPVCAAVDLASAPMPAAESPQSSGDNPGSSGQRRSQQGNSSGSPSAATAGKSFKEVHAERNKQAQRRFRQRQKVPHVSTFLTCRPFSTCNAPMASGPSA